jgi:flagellar basal-body rod protein FlgG
METVPPGTRLQHDAGTLFLPDPSRQPLALDARRLHQGHLEESNVSTVGSMVDMIEIQRTYASVQKVLTTLDTVRGMITNDLSRVG